jgi:hypothetical protein
MWLLLSGEGVSDMGACHPAMEFCESTEFKAGPMAWFVDQYVEMKLNYSHIDNHLVRFIGKQKLTELGKSLAHKKKLKLSGAKQRNETLYYRRNARAMAIEAKKLEQELNDKVVAVLFRDADGTQSSDRGEWQAKWDSMKNGFEDEGFNRGVPMIPKPKSEAWLLCAVKETPYQHCAALEDESGNGDSANPLKYQLQLALNGETAAEQLTELVENKTIDILHIDMPSFNQFKDRLDGVLTA